MLLQVWLLWGSLQSSPYFFCKFVPFLASFLFIFVLSKPQLTNRLKKQRCCAWDSNTGPQDGRARRIHWAMVARFITLHIWSNISSSRWRWIGTRGEEWKRWEVAMRGNCFQGDNNDRHISISIYLCVCRLLSVRSGADAINKIYSILRNAEIKLRWWVKTMNLACNNPSAMLF